MIDVNIKGVLYGIAAVLPHMKAQRSGHIINVLSVAGLKVRAGIAVYAATKTAVRVISEGLRQDVKPYNIRRPSSRRVRSRLSFPTASPSPTSRRTCARPMKAPFLPTHFARAVLFAMSQPADLDINEIVFRPTIQEF